MLLITLSLQVDVVDVNDCKPVFRSAVMDVHIGEGALMGDLVTTLSSLDQDVGQNAAVTYSFLSGIVYLYTSLTNSWLTGVMNRIYSTIYAIWYNHI